jgi:Na+/melibiose symporter-like transporter
LRNPAQLFVWKAGVYTQEPAHQFYVLMSMAFTAVDVPYWTLPAAFHFTMTAVAGLGFLPGIIPMLFNDFDDKMYAEITADLERRRAQKTQGE